MFMKNWRLLKVHYLALLDIFKNMTGLQCTPIYNWKHVFKSQKPNKETPKCNNITKSISFIESLLPNLDEATQD